MLRLMTAATVEPVSLDEAKAHLRLTDSEEDALIRAYITAAREVVERQTGYALAEATYAWSGEDVEEIPLLPAQRTSQEGEKPFVFVTHPGPVPAPLRAAILLLVGDLYANREAAVERNVENPAFSRLISPYQRVSL